MNLLVGLFAFGLVAMALGCLTALPLVVMLVLRHVERTQTVGGQSVDLMRTERELQVEMLEADKNREHEKAIERTRAAADVAAKRAAGAFG